MLIAGDGDLMAELRQQATALGIADRVVFAGHRTDVPDLLGALDVFCISSLYEGTPLALFEAMAAGKAIVSTSVDGCREVLEDGVTGVLVPPGDAAALASGLDRVLGDAALREGLGRQRARRLAPLRRARLCRPDAGLLRRAALRREGLRPMPLRRLSRSAREAWEVPRDLLRGRYPPFVTGGELPRGDVPVFVFHGAEPDSFSRKLAHLAENGYVTLSADEYVAVLRGQRQPEERAVVLTFDDGRGSVWSVAAPLLRRHGMKAVVFLVPGRIASRPGRPEPTWADVESGRADAASLLRREEGEGALMSWEEIEALAGTGLFDFQSHTLRHARVHTGPQLAGFVTPRSRRGYDAFDQPLLGDGERDLMGEEAPLGAPLLRSAPRTSEELRFHEDPGVRAACVAEVEESGGEGFFLRADWEARLRRAFGRTHVTGRIETPDERARAIRLRARRVAPD